MPSARPPTPQAPPGVTIRRRRSAHNSSTADTAKRSTLGDVLLEPTRLYVKSALAAIGTGGVKGLAHITGGGLTDNLPRALPEGLEAEIDLSTWTPQGVFRWLAHEGGIEESEMLRTFNCGIGMAVVAERSQTDDIISAFQREGQSARTIGTLKRGAGAPAVRYSGSLQL